LDRREEVLLSVIDGGALEGVGVLEGPVVVGVVETGFVVEDEELDEERSVRLIARRKRSFNAMVVSLVSCVSYRLQCC